MGLYDKSIPDKKQTLQALKHKYLAYFTWSRKSKENIAAGAEQASKGKMVENKVGEVAKIHTEDWEATVRIFNFIKCDWIAFKRTGEEVETSYTDNSFEGLCYKGRQRLSFLFSLLIYERYLQILETDRTG